MNIKSKLGLLAATAAIAGMGMDTPPPQERKKACDFRAVLNKKQRKNRAKSKAAKKARRGQR